MPVTETLFYYTEDDFKIPSIDERKMLSEIAINDPKAFANLVETAKAQLNK